MPGLTPISEGTETLTPVSEASRVAAALSEAVETLTGLTEFASVAAYDNPALYPSPSTFPSVAGTYPSLGSHVAGVGLQLPALDERTETLTPLAEA